MVDEYGNVVDIAVSGISKDDVAVGINFFIPIHEALRILQLKLDQVVTSDR